MKPGLWAIVFCFLVAPVLGAQQEVVGRAVLKERPNILVIIMDDVGVDKVAAYDEHPFPPPTPNIDTLAQNGLLFRNAYSNPYCSPTRATIMTGRYSFRTGVGDPIRSLEVDEYALPLQEYMIPEYLEDSGVGYQHAALGKWHLGSGDIGGADNPNLHGFSHYSGPLGNLTDENGYFCFDKTINGVTNEQKVYATTDQVDDAINQIQSMQDPWFIWMAFNAAHRPVHAPPDHLHSYDLSGDPCDTSIEHYNATVEAMDSEIGRLLSSIDAETWANTNIILLGDNGTIGQGVESPWPWYQQSKPRMYEGGVNVPLIMCGPDMVDPGREVTAFVNTVDLFPTIAALARIELSKFVPLGRKIDGISMMTLLKDPDAAPIREYVYAEKFEPNGLPENTDYDKYHRMVRDDRWKLIEFDEDPPRADEFYDMQGLNIEDTNLLEGQLTPEQQDAYDRLKAEMSAIRNS